MEYAFAFSVFFLLIACVVITCCISFRYGMLAFVDFLQFIGKKLGLDWYRNFFLLGLASFVLCGMIFLFAGVNFISEVLFYAGFVFFGLMAIVGALEFLKADKHK
ncbi:hypothetical protein CQA49_00030 [Helicobacter sp. MIT 00-7814]|uniref:hypothetical protein n=1 Tax=unclassified Helicobacter TaxID=2593540 RepID=UPI000E1ED4B3|nr:MULTISPECIES: hypothetical protein [unclassified Helicobacter]RDU57092.1 hypothetical protein CQA49_00030 [Helicobacter sp. MIT 00-7814]RDU57643.1 hypothetical protein CQA37_00030 [Helicobacter sp. MIT 99-10781]